MIDNAISQSYLKELMYVIFRWKRPVILFFFITIIIVGISTALEQPVFEASSKILVKASRDNIVFSTQGNQASRVFVEQKEVFASEAEILRSWLLCERVVKEIGSLTIFPKLKAFIKNSRSVSLEDTINPGADISRDLDKLATENLYNNISVTPVKGSNLMSLTVKHHNAEMSATLTNKIAEAYLDHNLQINKTKQTFNFFQNQTESIKKRIFELQNNISTVKEKHKITSIDEQKSILLNHEASIRRELDQAVSKEIETANRLLELERQLKRTPENISQEKTTDQNDALISVLQARLVELELREKELSGKYTDENRMVANVRNEIKSLKNKIFETENTTVGRSTFGLNPNYLFLKREIISHRTEATALIAKRTVLEKQLGEYQKELSKINRIEEEYNELQKELKIDEDKFKIYLNKLEESKISNAMDNERISNVTLVEKAHVPVKPISPNIILNIGLGFSFAVLGGFGIAFFMNFISQTVNRPEELEALLNVPVLASIPNWKTEQKK
jgi:uncharacterized protein involved in exopolysaccharide biosynthesis